MRILSPALSTAALILLVACNSARRPSTENFATVINQYLEQHGKACTLIGREFPIDVPASAQQAQYGFGPQLSALQQAGLVSETDTTAVVHSLLDPLRGSTPPRPVRRYQLTAEGQRYFQQVPGTFGKTGGFCFGQKVVDSVPKWTDPVTTGGVSQTEVTYTYRIESLASWASRPDILQAFPDIQTTVMGASKASQRIGLSLTDRGWVVSGS